VRELGDAMTYMLSARELLDLALPRMKRLAADFFEGKDRAFIGSGLSANRKLSRNGLLGSVQRPRSVVVQGMEMIFSP
jgi:hypothetical protein